MIKVGMKVKIKDNAFEGSLEPDDILARGKVGQVVYIGRNGEIEVVTDDDRDYYLLTVDEIEEIT